MKKCMLIALITIFALVSVGALCSAQPTYRSKIGVTNTSKKGSLLIYPLVKVSPEQADGNDTIITLSNDYPGLVKIVCQYSVPDGCLCGTLRDFTLTANQSISFSAKTGRDLDGQQLPLRAGAPPWPWNGEYTGELRCWAVKGDKWPIAWNHLSGTATLIEGEGEERRSWQYSAWRFAVGYDVQHNTIVPDAQGNDTKTIRLTGSPTTYDACPSSLIFNHITQVQDPAIGPYGDNETENKLTLVPCKQDCVDGGDRTVGVTFDLYDETELSSVVYACIDCTDSASAYYSKSLTTKVDNPSLFTSREMKGPSGMGIVKNFPFPISDRGCKGLSYGIPVVGVISNQFSSPTGPIAGETLTVHGRGQPHVLDSSGGILGEVIMTYK